MGFLEPDRYFSRISKIDVERDLLGCGLRFALLDVDNTIRSRATHDMPRDVGFWLARARSLGVSFCLVSNNWHDDIFTFANRLSLPVVAKAMKPLPPGYIMGMKRIGGTRADTVVIGDQLSTDVVGAHAVGLRAYLVQPLVEQDLKHTKVIRQFERALLGDRAPEGAPSGAAAGGQRFADECTKTDGTETR